MSVPFIDLRRFEPGFTDRWAALCADLTAKTQFVGGPEVARLEAGLAAESAVAGVVSCANGTDAIQLALRAVDVGPGDTVLVPDLTFWASYEAIVNVGAKPVTVDVDATDLQMDFGRFREAIEKYRPKAAILVHLYGWASARLGDFRALAAEMDVRLVEDAAQAYGVTWRGESIFKGAEIATLSFYPAKVLGANGDAGAVYCSTEEQAGLVRRLANHGRDTHYGYSHVGWNSRMGGFEGAFLNLSRDYVAERIASRRATAAHYRERLVELDLCAVAAPADIVENGYLNVVLVEPERRSAFEAVLREKGIGFQNVYPSPISIQPGAKADLAGKVGGETAALITRSVVNLPLFPYLMEAEFEEVMAAVEVAAAAARA